MSTPYLGSKISLISRLDIRYEGILYTVDSNESTIALAKVRSYGTENRPTEHPVKAREEVYEYIIFKASDIKDLHVLTEGPKQSEPGDLDYDPAIVSVSKPPVRSEPAQASLPTEPTPKTPSPVSKQVPVGKPVQQQSGSNPPPPYHRKQQNWQGDNNRFQQPQQRQGNFNNRPFHQQQNPGYSNQRLPNQQNRPSFNRTAAPKEKLKAFNLLADYDFETANEQFKEKLDVVADELAEKIDLNVEQEESNNSGDENEEKEPAGNFYDKKSSFFDSISCEASEKADGKTNRPDWKKERQTNYETFGQNSVRSHAYQNYHRRFNNQGGFRPGNRPQQAGGEQQRYVPRQNNGPNGPGNNFQGNRPRFNNRDQQQNRDNQRPNQNRAYY